MSRARKIAPWILGIIVVPILIGIVVLALVSQTQWFRDTVRDRVIASVEASTGGRAEIAAFNWDWTTLTAELTNFVLHGKEAPTDAPLLRGRRLQIQLKITTAVKEFIDIAGLSIDDPRANIIVYPDGTTNVPSPKVKQSNKPALQTVVDLAIGHFELRNGYIQFGERKMDLDARGENLRAVLDYNPLSPSYQGKLTMKPLYLRSGPNPTLPLTVSLPVRIDAGKISIDNGAIDSPESKFLVTGFVQNLEHPLVNVRLNAQVSLPEAARATGTKLGNAPKFLNADISASMDENRIAVQSAHVNLGRSNIEASGVLRDEKSGQAALQFNAQLAAAELGRIFNYPIENAGTVRVKGDAKMAGNLIQLSQLQMQGLGGTFNGDASLEDMRRFRVHGTLQNFDTRQVAGTLANTNLNIDGVVSGPIEVEGDLKAPGSTGIQAKADLSIAPGRRGTPLSGHVAVNFNGRTNTIDMGNTQLNLPHTNLQVSGSLGQKIQVRMVSKDLTDLASLAGGKPLPIVLRGGTATFTGTVTGTTSDPNIAGHLLVTNFTVEDRPFDRLETDITASPSRARLSNASLTRKALQAHFDAAVGLHHWKPEDRDPLQASLSIQNADMQDLLALAGQRGIDVTGAVSATAHVNGTVGDPHGGAEINAGRGAAFGQPFDSAKARVNYGGRLIEVPSAEMAASAERVTMNASFEHPMNSFSSGRLRAGVSTTGVSLARARKGLTGIAQINAEGAAILNKSEWQVVDLNGDAKLRGLTLNGEQLGNLDATAHTQGALLSYKLDSDFAGSSTHVSGQSRLDGDHATTANLNIANLPIQKVLAVAGEEQLGASGILAAQGQVSGTLDDPRANLQLSVSRGAVEGQPFDRLSAQFNYSKQSIDLPSFTLAAAGGTVDASGTFTHPANDFRNGRVVFRIAANHVQAAQIAMVKNARPGLAAVLQFNASGDATVKNGRVLPSVLNGDLSAGGVQIDKKPAGDLRLTAVTRGSELTFNLNSGFAGAQVKGAGKLTLTGNYPIQADASFSNLTYAGLQPWLGPSAPEPGREFGAAADGRINVSGPIEAPAQMRGALELTRVQISGGRANPAGQRAGEITLTNAGPVVIALDQSRINVQSAHLKGPGTDISVTGFAPLASNQPMDLRVNGSVDLKNVEAFNENVFASGAVSLNASARGTLANPNMQGALTLKNASFNMIDLPNGLSNANGTVTFSGRQATFQRITGEVGGGTVTLTGNVAYASDLNFQLRATAADVRIQNPPGVTTALNAGLQLQGTAAASVLSGTVTVKEVAYRPQTDFSSILSQTATPPEAPQAKTGLLGGMRLDVRVDTASDVQYTTTLAQNLDAEAHLRLRGMAYQPGMLGRVDVTQGEIVFFGNKYKVNRGTISFFNPSRIDPVFNVDLETQTKGVDVIVSVNGPMSKLNMSYRSDPPLPFSDIVGLLATGRIPTSDPVLAAKEPPAPEQSWEQMGASTLLGTAIANPVSGRLQRLFGVTKLKIDPQITGLANTPQARLTFEQQISRELTFTYIQDVTQSNPQIVRIEWAINPRWSVVALRDTNGVFGLDFFYKKRIH